jgi:hypothetical protein
VSKLVALHLRADDFESVTETAAPPPTQRQSNSCVGSSLGTVKALLVSGQRKDVVDEVLATGNFAIALLSTMRSYDVCQHAVKCFAGNALSEGQPLRTIALHIPRRLLYPSDDSTSLCYWDSISHEAFETGLDDLLLTSDAPIEAFIKRRRMNGRSAMEPQRLQFQASSLSK